MRLVLKLDLSLDNSLPKADPQRAGRYDLIGTVLPSYCWANRKVPELDRIVRLSPAPLPPRDGKIQWLKDFEANVAPPLPPEQCIRERTAAKARNPATSRPGAKRQQAQTVQAAPRGCPAKRQSAAFTGIAPCN